MPQKGDEWSVGIQLRLELSLNIAWDSALRAEKGTSQERLQVVCESVHIRTSDLSQDLSSRDWTLG